MAQIERSTSAEIPSRLRLSQQRRHGDLAETNKHCISGVAERRGPGGASTSRVRHTLSESNLNLEPPLP